MNGIVLQIILDTCYSLDIARNSSIGLKGSSIALENVACGQRAQCFLTGWLGVGVCEFLYLYLYDFCFPIQYLYFFLQSLASQAVRGKARGCVIPAPTFQNPERLTKWNLRGFQLTESEKYSFRLDPTAIS